MNVLLSFAQFEREVTAERIRDKIAASKKKGLWMGGAVPLGYDRHPDPQRRELVVNPAEAEVVQTLFQLYERLGNLRLVEIEAARLGLRPKAVAPREAGKTRRIRGASPFSRGQMHHLMMNPVYIGRIRHKEQSYPGLHPAIIDETLWQAVQDNLLAARARPRGRSLAATESLILTGKLRDETGDLLTPTHTQRHGRRFAYYVSNRLISGGRDPTGWRLPAEALERSLRQIIVTHIRAAANRHAILARPDASRAEAVARRALSFVDRIEAEPDLLGHLLQNGTMGPRRIALTLDTSALAKALSIDPPDLAPELTSIREPFQLRRRGIETRIIAGETRPAPDPVLQRTLADSHAWAQALRTGTSLTEIARETGYSEPYIRTRIPLAFLAPQLQTAILDGRQPADLSVARLIRDGIPMDWNEQARIFGVA